MRITTLLAIALIAAIGAGCGDDDGDGGQEPARAGAVEGSGESGDAMKKDEGDAMKDGGDAMKDEGDAMKKDEGDAMKDDDSAAGGDAKMTSAASASTARGKVVKVVGSDYGRVIADGKGEAFYLFDKEKGSRSRCFGECARVWPPVLTKGRPRAGKGAAAALLGTTRRPNGRLQVTYDGHPLYYYVDDRPGLILCHDVAEFGGLWLVVKPDGSPV